MVCPANENNICGRDSWCMPLSSYRLPPAWFVPVEQSAMVGHDAYALSALCTIAFYEFAIICLCFYLCMS